MSVKNSIVIKEALRALLVQSRSKFIPLVSMEMFIGSHTIRDTVSGSNRQFSIGQSLQVTLTGLNFFVFSFGHFFFRWSETDIFLFQ